MKKIIQPLILLLTVQICHLNISATEAIPTIGDVRVKALCTDSEFIIQYYNTEDKMHFQDVYSHSGTLVGKKAIVPEELATHRFQKWFSNGIPTGDSSPIGKYWPPQGFSATYYVDSVLYVLVGPSIPENLNVPYLEIKERKHEAKRLELKWCKEKIGFSPRIFLVNANHITGVTPLLDTDSVYIFTGNIIGDS